MNRGKGILTFIACLFAMMVQAGPIGRDAALKTAAAFMQAKGLSVSQTAAPAARAPRKSAAQQDASCYYVFNADGARGFVIVSGDDRTVPVLGYSLSGSFNPDSIPDNMRAWLQGYADQIEALDASGAEASAADTASAGGVPRMAMSTQVIEPLLTVTWNQGTPYNDYCPLYSPTGERCVTGCVATAMAQVMYYHRWPAATTAEIPAYTTTSYGLAVDAVPAGSVIDWDSMQADYDWHSYTAQSAKAVAELMQYCGTALTMDYGPSSAGGSEIQSANVSPALKKYFGYDENIYCAVRSDYSIAQWNSLMLQELSAGRPVVYGGESTGGGHCFVIDGYDGNELFHVNWGWGNNGSFNGYYVLSVLNPYNNDGVGASSSSDGYSMNQDAIVGIQPAGASNPITRPAASTNQLITQDLHVEGTYVVCSFWNYTEEAGSFYFGFFTKDSNGNLAIQRMTYTDFLPPNYGFVNRGVDVSSLNLSEGTYRMYAIGMKDNWEDLFTGGVTWKENEYVLITVAADGSLTLEQYPTIDLSISDVTLPDSPRVGTEQKIVATVSNNGDEYNGKFYIFAQAASDTSPSLIMRTGAAIPEGGSMDVEIYFTPQTAGTNKILIATDQDCANVVGSFDLDVKENDIPQAELFISNAWLESGTPMTNNEVILTVTVTNTGGDFSGPIYAGVGLSSDEYLNVIGSEVVDIPSGGSVNITYSFTPTVAGEYIFGLATLKDGALTMFADLYFDVVDPIPSAGLEVQSLDLNNTPMVNRESEFNVTIAATTGDYKGPLYAFIASDAEFEAGEWHEVMYQEVDILSGGSVSLDFAYTFAEDGEHWVWLSADESGEYPITERFSFDVAPAPALKLTSYVLPDNPRVNATLHVKAVLTNYGSPYSGTLRVMAALGDVTLSDIYSQEATVDAGDSVTVEFDVTPSRADTYHFFLFADYKYAGNFDMEVQPLSDLLGDIDGNGRLDVTDVTLLSKYISDGRGEGLLVGNADLNGDGRINVTDVVVLARLISNQ